LAELQKIDRALEKKRSIPYFSESTLLSNFNGNTLISIFCNEKRVLDEIVEKLDNTDGLEDVEDLLGTDCQSPTLRRLFRVLILPVKDLIYTANNYTGEVNILRKSLYFNSSRQRESLLKLATKCKESDVQSFVFHLEDIKVFFDNMTPAMEEFLGECLLSNKFTRELDSVKATPIEDIVVLNRQNSAINSDRIETELDDGAHEDHKEF
jgi:hypothetical protein